MALRFFVCIIKNANGLIMIHAYFVKSGTTGQTGPASLFVGGIHPRKEDTKVGESAELSYDVGSKRRGNSRIKCNHTADVKY
jgi:hypothetical protein